MALATMARPQTGGAGYGPSQRIPVDDGSPPPQSNDPNEVNQWLQTQPWYLSAMQAWGQDPSHPVLDIQRRAQVLDATMRAGATLGNDFNINTNGQFENIKTPTAVKVALYAMGAWAGGAALAGAAGGGGGGAAAASTIADPGIGAAGVPASLAAEGGGAAAAGAGGGAAATEGGLLASHAVAPTTGALAPAVVPSGAVPAAYAGSAATGATTAERIAQGLRGGGQAVGAATNAAGNNRRYEDDFGLGLANEQDDRSKLEQQQRQTALADAYRESWYETRKPGPNDHQPLQEMTPEFMAALANKGRQGREILGKPAQYGTTALPALPTGPTQPGTMEQVGNWLSPTLSTAGLIASLFK